MSGQQKGIGRELGFEDQERVIKTERDAQELGFEDQVSDEKTTKPPVRGRTVSVRAASGQVRQGMGAEEALRALYPLEPPTGGQRLKGTSKYVLDSYGGTGLS